MTIQLPTLNSLLPLIKANPQGNILPLSVELIADTENPITLFSKITRNQPGSVLLESVLNAEHRARYSFILTNPTETQISLEAIQNKLKNLRPIAHFDLPIFTGGYVGSVNYEMIHQFEPTVPVLGQGKVDFKRYDSIIVFDHFTSKILLISNLFLDNPLEKEFKKAKQQLTDLHQIYQ
ncbi:MAG: anthranilate synthase, anthranilate synthase component I, partial [Candidatus Peregrinibacteria bacterium GW2011_GWE2_39_6]